MTNESIERNQLLSVARELYGRLAWSHKTHEKERELCSTHAFYLKWLNVLFTAITGILAIASATNQQIESLKWWTVMAGAITTAYTLYQVSFDPTKAEAQHRQTSKRLLSLRDRMLFVIQKLCGNIESTYDLQRELEAINKEIALAYAFAPDTSAKAYGQASKGLKEQEELTFSEEEVDIMLPAPLRSSSLQTVPSQEEH